MAGLDELLRQARRLLDRVANVGDDEDVRHNARQVLGKRCNASRLQRGKGLGGEQDVAAGERFDLLRQGRKSRLAVIERASFATAEGDGEERVVSADLRH